MKVTMRTAGRFWIGNYNQSVPIEFDCALCGLELDTEDGFVSHPAKIETGFFRKKLQKIDCEQAGMKALAVIELPYA